MKQIRVFLLPVLMLGLFQPVLCGLNDESVRQNNDTGMAARVKRYARKICHCLIGNEKACTKDEIFKARLMTAYFIFIGAKYYEKYLENSSHTAPGQAPAVISPVQNTHWPEDARHSRTSRNNERRQQQERVSARRAFAGISDPAEDQNDNDSNNNDHHDYLTRRRLQAARGAGNSDHGQESSNWVLRMLIETQLVRQIPELNNYPSELQERLITVVIQHRDSDELGAYLGSTIQDYYAQLHREEQSSTPSLSATAKKQLKQLWDKWWKSAEHAVAEGAEDICCVCFDESPEQLNYIPCPAETLHAKICLDCLSKHIASGRGNAVCPICRERLIFQARS